MIMEDKKVNEVNLNGIIYTQFEREDGSRYWEQTYPHRCD